MKKTLCSLLLALGILLSTEGKAMAGEDISAKAAIVYEPRSGSVLYEKCADEPMLIASTTKILTAMIVIENCGLDERVDVSHAHASTEGSSMYLRPGGDYSVEDLLYGLMLASGNDAAAALADHTAGSMEAFAELMNRKAEELGLQNSSFANAHGLDAEGHYSSARDLALITAKAMENGTFCEIFSTAHYCVGGVDYYNHNKLLSSCPGCIGGKTGYTEKAGRSLVSCVERDGMRLICVTLSDPRDWEDHAALYERCFEEFEFVPIPDAGLKSALISDDEEFVELRPEKMGFVVGREEETFLRLHLPRFVFPPVQRASKAGYAELLSGGEILDRTDIYYARSVYGDYRGPREDN